MKKVLIIDAKFPNTGGNRTEKFVKFLPKFGWKPLVLTIDQTKKNPYFKNIISQYDKRKFQLYNTKTILSFFCLNKFRMERLSGFLSSLLFIPDKTIAWFPLAVNMGCRIIKKENPQIIYSTSPSEGVHLIAYQLKKRTGLPWVADFRDLWTQYKKRYKPLTNFHHLINKFIERSIYCRWSDAIVANTEENKDIILNNFKIKTDKINIITNGYDLDDISKISKINLIDKKKKFTIGYMGGLEKTAICYKEFLSGFSLALKKENNISLQLWSVISKKLNRDIFKSSIIKKHVVLNEYLPHKECMKAIAKVDIFVVLLSKGYENVVPQKLFNYLCYEKPILAVVPSSGRAAKIIKDCNCGRVVEPDNIAGIAKAILDYYVKWKKRPIQLIKKNEEKLKYNRVNLTQELVMLFTKTLSKKNIKTDIM